MKSEKVNRKAVVAAVLVLTALVVLTSAALYHLGRVHGRIEVREEYEQTNISDTLVHPEM